jgi:hypothetical protein
MSTKTIKCNCSNEYQDEVYGVGNRAANETSNGQYRCTVCGVVVGSAQTVTVSKKEATKESPTKAGPSKSKKAEKKGEKSTKLSAKKSLKGGKR